MLEKELAKNLSQVKRGVVPYVGTVNGMVVGTEIMKWSGVVIRNFGGNVNPIEIQQEL
jgi:hypothetical protein